MFITETKWSQSYMQGVLDVSLGKVSEETIKEFAYYLQSQNINKHPDCILFYDDFLLDNKDLFEQYEAYTKAVIETADITYLLTIAYIFRQSAFDAVEDYDIEASHIDENYTGLQNLQYVDIEINSRIIKIYTSLI